MHHVDLFTGIGGFSMAAEACGITTVAQVEIDPTCRKYLASQWPDAERSEDVRQFNGSRFRGAFLLTAGTPCQPASQAGRQHGEGDDRWLWPEAIRILSEVRPTWALFENPHGIADLAIGGVLPPVDGLGAPIRDNGNLCRRGDAHVRRAGGALDDILGQIETLGYEAVTISIPACAVNAPHRRDRYWIVGHAIGRRCTGESRWRTGKVTENGLRDVADSNEPGRQGADAERRSDGLRSEHREGDGADSLADTSEPNRCRCGPNPSRCSGGAQGSMCDAERAGISGKRSIERHKEGACSGDDRPGSWDDSVWVPCADAKFRRAPRIAELLVDGLPMDVVDRLAEEGWPHRSVISALGNSIVWQVAREIIAAIVAAEEEEVHHAQ